MRFPLPYVLVAAILVFVGAFWVYDLYRSDFSGRAVRFTGTDYVRSEACAVCHRGRYESWHRTYHRTMTAPATPANVKAPIDGRIDLSFFGQDVTFERRGDAYFVTLPYQGGTPRTFRIAYTIGSHRMQQFAIRDDDRVFRIPVFYSLQDSTWMHVKEAFFYRKGSGDVAEFVEGYSIWNPNCIFCHNTRPNPRLDKARMTFQSTVGELGIACEECHAPGETHVRENVNPLRRYFLAYTGRRDASVIQPERLRKERSVQVCGQCHGQRVPSPLSRIDDVMAHGDPFIPGRDLSEYYQPVRRDSRLPGYDSFKLRFWEDGTPRLTAYEYQALTASKCYLASDDLTCTTCHDAHGGDPAGMIRPAMRTDAACLQCHHEYEPLEARLVHTKHREGVTTCFDCHMPNAIYGVQSIHPSHLIRSPDPTRTARYGMPNACNNCHLKQTVRWATERTETYWKIDLPALPDDDALGLPEVARGMALGDVVYRTMLMDQARRRKVDLGKLFAEGLRDPFYAVNHFTRRALRVVYGDATGDEVWMQRLAQQADTLDAIFRHLRATRAIDEEAFEFGE